GPAGAFVGLVAIVVERHGYDGLALATVIAGLVLITVGLLRVGTYIKYIPFPDNAGQATNRDVMISGAFFFGATARVLGVLDRVGAPRLLVLDFKDVPLIDTTAARSLVAFVNKLERLGTSVVFAAARPTVRRTLNRAGLKPPLVRYSATAQDAVAMIPQ
ncbi:MAG: STAS domain-containing protein, partial [Pseudolabrys sp.]